MDVAGGPLLEERVQELFVFVTHRAAASSIATDVRILDLLRTREGAVSQGGRSA